MDVDTILDFRLDSRYAKQIDSTADNPVWFKDLSDGIYALRGVFGGGVRLFDNEIYSFAILRKEFNTIAHLLHTKDFVTFYNTTILVDGSIPIHEPVDNGVPDLSLVLRRDADIPDDIYSATDDSILTYEQINSLISERLSTPKPSVLLDGDDGIMYTIQIEGGQLTVKPL